MMSLKDNIQHQSDVDIKKYFEERQIKKSLHRRISYSTEKFFQRRSITPQAKSSEKSVKSSLNYAIKRLNRLKQDNKGIRHSIDNARKDKMNLQSLIHNLEKSVEKTRSRSIIEKEKSEKCLKSLPTLPKHLSVHENSSKFHTSHFSKPSVQNKTLKDLLKFDMFIDFDLKESYVLLKSISKYWKDKCNNKRKDLSNYQKRIEELRQMFKTAEAISAYSSSEELTQAIVKSEEQIVSVLSFLSRITFETEELEDSIKMLPVKQECSKQVKDERFEILSRKINDTVLQENAVRQSVQDACKFTEKIQQLFQKANFCKMIPSFEPIQTDISPSNVLSYIGICEDYIMQLDGISENMLYRDKTRSDRSWMKVLHSHNLVRKDTFKNCNRPLTKKEFLGTLEENDINQLF